MNIEATDKALTIEDVRRAREEWKKQNHLGPRMIVVSPAVWDWYRRRT